MKGGVDSTTLQPCGVLLEFHRMKKIQQRKKKRKKASAFVQAMLIKSSVGVSPGLREWRGTTQCCVGTNTALRGLVDLADVCYVRFCLIEPR